MASSHILQIFLRVIIQDQIRISQRVSSSTQPVSMLNLQILSSYFMCDFRDMVFFLIRFRTHSRRERAGIIISEENKKSEPISYWKQVRIIFVWSTLHINKRTIPFMRLPATFHWLNTNFRPVCGAPHNL